MHVLINCIHCISTLCIQISVYKRLKIITVVYVLSVRSVDDQPLTIKTQLEASRVTSTNFCHAYSHITHAIFSDSHVILKNNAFGNLVKLFGPPY